MPGGREAIEGRAPVLGPPLPPPSSPSSPSPSPGSGGGGKGRSGYGSAALLGGPQQRRSSPGRVGRATKGDDEAEDSEAEMAGRSMTLQPGGRWERAAVRVVPR